MTPQRRRTGIYHGGMDPADERIRRQLDLNADKNLLFKDLEEVMEIDPLFLAALEESVAAAAPAPSAEAAADMLVERVHRINQFVTVDAAARERLTGVYRQTWEAMRRGGDASGILREVHYPSIRRWAASVYPREMAEALAASPGIGRVACGEYSAETQLAVLRLDPAAIAGPLLDIGCGREATLVRRLRAMGVDAHGVDRDADAEEPWLARGDWLDLAPRPGAWGTVVSHLAFTNHLAYVERFEPGRLPRYEQVFGLILESLAPGGCFHYAPSLPRLERALPRDRFALCTHAVRAGVGAAVVRRLPSRQ
jgi:hypothetical protein